MFLKIIKNFLLKNKVSKLLSNPPANDSVGVIQNVGVIFDGNLNIKIEDVLKEFIVHGIDENQIKVLIFKNALKTYFHCFFEFLLQRNFHKSLIVF